MKLSKMQFKYMKKLNKEKHEIHDALVPQVCSPMMHWSLADLTTFACLVYFENNITETRLI